VDPVAADRIVEYMRTVRRAQGILFASHRIDECLSICKRVCMLYDGEKRFDGAIGIFDGIAAKYYQVDINTAVDNRQTKGQRNFIVDRIAAACGSASKIARCMEYSTTLVRITFLKDEVPFTFVWKLLNLYRQAGLIRKYSFRAMGTEEVLSTMISNSKETKTD